jgi:hypothetical protein
VEEASAEKFDLAFKIWKLSYSLWRIKIALFIRSLEEQERLKPPKETMKTKVRYMIELLLVCIACMFSSLGQSTNRTPLTAVVRAQQLAEMEAQMRTSMSNAAVQAAAYSAERKAMALTNPVPAAPVVKPQPRAQKIATWENSSYLDEHPELKGPYRDMMLRMYERQAKSPEGAAKLQALKDIYSTNGVKTGSLESFYGRDKNATTNK